MESPAGRQELRPVRLAAKTTCRDVALTIDTMSSPVGTLLIAAREEGIVLCAFADDQTAHDEAIRSLSRRMAAGGEKAAIVAGPSEHLRTLRRELDEYFSHQRSEFSVPLVLHGTEFEKRAWTALKSIPHGQTISYGEQASRIGSPKAVRAIGRANGANTIAIVVPCHRVIGAGGNLTGYGGGMHRKQWLLNHEYGLLS